MFTYQTAHMEEISLYLSTIYNKPVFIPELADKKASVIKQCVFMAHAEEIKSLGKYLQKILNSVSRTERDFNQLYLTATFNSVKGYICIPSGQFIYVSLLYKWKNILQCIKLLLK